MRPPYYFSFGKARALKGAGNADLGEAVDFFDFPAAIMIGARLAGRPGRLLAFETHPAPASKV